MERYRYEGRVLEFDKCVSEKWIGETVAVSPEKARSNLAYRFKMQTGRNARSKIILPGKIERSYI